MKLIPIKELEAGMVLGAAVEDANGRLLLAAGETLRKGFPEALAKRGIRTVTVEEPSDREPDPTPGEMLEQAQAEDDGPTPEAQLDFLFEPYEGQEPYDTLKTIIWKHFEQGMHTWGEAPAEEAS